MGSVSGCRGDEFSVVRFTSQVLQPPGVRLDAVAIWRGGRNAARAHGLMGNRWRAPVGWSGTADADGQREVLFHQRLRRVRAAGSEFPLPDGRTLVLLIDGTGVDSMPRVATRTIAAPVCARELPDASLAKAEVLERTHASHLAEQAAWGEALKGDGAIQRFLADGTWPDSDLPTLHRP